MVGAVPVDESLDAGREWCGGLKANIFDEIIDIGIGGGNIARLHG